MRGIFVSICIFISFYGLSQNTSSNTEIVIFRVSSGYQLFTNLIPVYIDDSMVCEMGPQSMIRIELDSGLHSIRVKGGTEIYRKHFAKSDSAYLIMNSTCRIIKGFKENSLIEIHNENKKKQLELEKWRNPFAPDYSLWLYGPRIKKEIRID